MSILDEAKRQQALAEAARKRNLPEWAHEMAQAVDDATIRSLVYDFRRGVPGPSSLAGKPTIQHKQQGSGWSDPVPLSNPPGVSIADRMNGSARSLGSSEKGQGAKGCWPDGEEGCRSLMTSIAK
jgi:hypothetical protein